MKIVYNKETRNENGLFYRNGDWGIEVPDDFSKSNFTDIVPPLNVKCDWVNNEWVIDTSIVQSVLDAMVYIEKLTIRRAMRSLGIEAALDAILTNEAFDKDWADAIEIDLNETMVQQALTQMGVDTDEIKREILKNA